MRRRGAGPPQAPRHVHSAAKGRFGSDPEVHTPPHGPFRLVWAPANAPIAGPAQARWAAASRAMGASATSTRLGPPVDRAFPAWIVLSRWRPTDVAPIRQSASGVHEGGGRILLLIVSALLGLLAGLVTGGSLRHLLARRLRWPLVVIAAFVVKELLIRSRLAAWPGAPAL